MTSSDPAPLLVLGGTFDPPHLGHLVLAECAASQFGGPVVFMPAGDPWRKSERGVSDAVDRIEMVRRAIAGNARFQLDEREAQREGPTYTADTLAELRAEGHERIVLIVGRDALDDMPHWHAPGRIRELATLAVAPRADDPPPSDSGVVAVDMPPLAIASTDIRQRVRAGKPIRYLLPAAVEEYIHERGLYR